MKLSRLLLFACCFVLALGAFAPRGAAQTTSNTTYPLVGLNGTSPSSCLGKFIGSGYTASGTVQLLPAPSPAILHYHICKAEVDVSQGATAANFQLVEGTGTNCGTGQTPVSALWPGVASATQSALDASTSFLDLIHLQAGDALCINFSAAPTAATIEVRYAIY